MLTSYSTLYNLTACPSICFTTLRFWRSGAPSEQVPVLRFRHIVHFHEVAHGAAPVEDRQPPKIPDSAPL